MMDERRRRLIKPHRASEGGTTWCIVGILVTLTLIFYTGVKEGSSLPSLQQLSIVVSWIDPAKTLVEMRKAFGLIAISLLSLSLLAGPLHRWSPTQVALTLMRARKRLGLIACAFAVVHSALSLGGWSALLGSAARAPVSKVSGVAAAVTALAIVFRMAVTSTERAKARMGARWKRVHRLGSVALALGIVHFLCMETDPSRGLHVRFYGLVVLAGAVTVAAVRAIDMAGAQRKQMGPTRVREKRSVADGSVRPPIEPNWPEDASHLAPLKRRQLPKR
jgi:sulfoxide reductase heme-binding subunit YedZ